MWEGDRDLIPADEFAGGSKQKIRGQIKRWTDKRQAILVADLDATQSSDDEARLKYCEDQIKAYESML